MKENTMNEKISPVTTAKGDQGFTTTATGNQVEKDCAQIEANGAIEELNATLGIVFSLASTNTLKNVIETVQQQLFDIGAIISNPLLNKPIDKHLNFLEKELKKFNNQTLTTTFKIPHHAQLAAQTYLACTICRRAERRIVTLAKETETDESLLKYLNRLSDLLFLLAME